MGIATARRVRARLLTIVCVLIAAVSTSVSGDALFDAVDTNGDHSISVKEYEEALGKFLSASTGDSGSGVAAGGAPGLDANPFSYREKKQPGTGINFKFDDDKGFFKALVASFSAIIATEIGDKTFFIAAVLSMRNARLAVFGGAILALIIMTVLSTLMGLVLPSLMPRTYTHIIGGLLFLYFGVKLVVDSRGMEDKVSEELEEVEEELAEMNKKKQRSKKKKQAENDSSSPDVDHGDIENGAEDDNGVKRRGGGGGRQTKPTPSSSGLGVASDYSGSSWESVFLQSLTMTFLAEWGDRSQIATIALAAAKDPVGVTIGGCLGHSICTGMAVLGGRLLATRISEKAVAFYGGLVFLAFGIHSVFFEE